jgi:hypothetical protein
MLRIATAGVMAVGAAAGAAVCQPGQPAHPQPPAKIAGRSILLADTSHQPHVRIAWPTRDGKTVALEGDRAYKSQGDKTLLGKNIELYVALGGTRLERGKADPDGAVVRAGLYKEDTSKLFFENIAEGGEITITIGNLKMNQPAEAQARSGLIHMRYMLSDLAACGIDSSGRNLLITADPQDALKDSYGADSTRLGWLDGTDKPGEDHGSVTVEAQPDGTSTVTFKLPYTLLRHIKDPYQRTTPGGFFEPQHFHVEVQFVPKAAADKAAGEGAPVQKPASGS